MFKRKYKCIRQNEASDCAAACIATLCAYYGSRISVTEIREIIGTDKNGSTVYGLVNALQHYKFATKAIRLQRNIKNYNLQLPCIAQVRNGKTLHFVVILELGKKALVADPAEGIKSLAICELEKVETGIYILAVPTSSYELLNYKKGKYKYLGRILKSNLKTIILVVILAILLTIVGIIGAFYSKILFDNIVPTSNQERLFVISSIFILFSILAALLSLFRNLLISRLSISIEKSLIQDYFCRIILLPYKFLSSRHGSELLSRLNDTNYISDALSGLAISTIVDAGMSIAGAVIVYQCSPKLFLIPLLIVGLYCIAVIKFKRPLEVGYNKIMGAAENYTSSVMDALDGIQDIKLYNASNYVEKLFNSSLEEVLTYEYKINYLVAFQGLVKEIVQRLGAIAVLGIGTYYIIYGDLTVGTLVTFNVLLDYFILPIKNIIDQQSKFQSGIAAYNRVFEIMNLEFEESDKNHNPGYKVKNGSIFINNITFRYGSRKPILYDLNISIATGEKVAIVGESGSGKSTIAKLLVRLFASEKGEISIGDTYIDDIGIRELRDIVAYVTQDIRLFKGTILQNLCFLKDIPLSKCRAVAQMTMADEFILKLPMQYDTVIEENGRNFSTGQRQKLALTRALLSNPKILILDEATSNVDSLAENCILNTIRSFIDMTVIIISHKLENVCRCDRILVVDDGKIVEAGTHAELAKLHGKYARLFGI